MTSLAVKQWKQLRRNGNYSLAISPINEIVRDVEQTVRRYLLAASQRNTRVQIEEMNTLRGSLNSISEVFSEGGDAKGYGEFLALLFDQASFSALYARWKQLLAQLTVTATSVAPRDEEAVKWTRREADAMRELLSLPTEYFGRTWSALIPDIAQATSSSVGKRLPILERSSSSTRRPVTTKRKPKVNVDPSVAQREERIQRQQLDDPFPVTESYKESNVPTPGLYVTTQYSTSKVYAGGDEELGDMIATLQTLQASRAPLPSVSEFWMLKHEAGFWVEEFFNISLASCDFSSPAVLEREQAFRRYILFNLLKLSLAAVQDSARYQGALRETIFSATQWREYMSTQFPLISMTLFDETPASGSAIALRQANQVPAGSYVLQALGFVEEYFVTEQAVAVEETFPLTAEMAKTLSETCDIKDPLISCCNGLVDLRASDFRRLLATAHGGELNDQIINQFLNPILKNADKSGTFIFISSQLPVVIGRSVERAARWKIDPPIQDRSRMLIPINLDGVHWYLLVVNFEKRQFEAYDSISPHRDNVNVAQVQRWLSAVTGSDYSEWPSVSVFGETLQPDLVSCGVYTCIFAQMLVEGIQDTSILGTEVSFLRSFLCEQILQGEVMPISDFDFQ